MQKLRNKVEAYLLKWGNNQEAVKDMMNLHFDVAYSLYGNSAKWMAEFIRTVY